MAGERKGAREGERERGRPFLGLSRSECYGRERARGKKQRERVGGGKVLWPSCIVGLQT